MKTIILTFAFALSCLAAAPDKAVLAAIDSVSRSMSLNGGMIQSHVARMQVGMSGGETFADGWSRISTPIHRQAMAAFNSLPEKDSTMTAYLEGVDPSSYVEVSNLLAAISRIRAAYVADNQ